MKFEDWFWYNNHAHLEYTSAQMVKYVTWNQLGLWIRRLLFLCSFGPVGVSIYYYGWEAITINWKYWTYWGKYSTWIALLLGSFINTLQPVEDINESNDYVKRKYSPFRLWKWWIFFYEWAICAETHITILFYAYLFTKEYWQSMSKVDKAQTVLNHGIPVLLLYLDFLFNTVPFCWRHLIFIVVMTYTYLFINIAITKGTGEPVYPGMDWTSWYSWGAMFSWSAIVSLTFVCLKFLSDLKLRYCGYSQCIINMQREQYFTLGKLKKNGSLKTPVNYSS